MADIVTPKPPGIIRSWSNHLQGTLKEPDGHTPSSARLLGSILILGVILIQLGVVLVLLVLLVRLDPAQANAPALATAYVGVLRIVLIHSLIFDTLSALSFYGINAWKYYFGLRTGDLASKLGSQVSPKDLPHDPITANLPADPDGSTATG